MRENVKGLSFDRLLKKQLGSEELNLLFDEHRFYLQVARLIAELRAQSGFSQQQLATRAKLSQPQIARLESGDHRRVPTFDTIYKVLKALGYTLSVSVKREKVQVA